MGFFNFSDNWGGFSNPLDYVIDNIKGTFVQRPADKAYYSPAFNTGVNKNGGIGALPYGPTYVPPGTTAPKTALTPKPTLGTAIKNQTIVPLPSAAAVASSVGTAVGTVLDSSQVFKFGILAISAIMVIKILK